MQDLEALRRELQRQGKSGELEKLAASEDGRKLGQMLDAQALQSALRSGDAGAVRGLLGGVLGTPEGQRLAGRLKALLQDKK